MKYLKLFENYKITEEIEDFVIDLLDSGMIEKSEDGRNFQELKLVKKNSSSSWIPTHYSMKFKLKIKTVLTSLEDIEFNRNLYDRIYEIVYRFGAEFKVSLNHLTLFVECGDSVKNFFRTRGVGNGFIDFAPEGLTSRIVSRCSVYKIEDDFSVIFRTSTLRNYTLEEGLNFVKGVVESETDYKYNAEVWGQDLGHIKDIYIRVKP